MPPNYTYHCCMCMAQVPKEGIRDHMQSPGQHKVVTRISCNHCTGCGTIIEAPDLSTAAAQVRGLE